MKQNNMTTHQLVPDAINHEIESMNREGWSLVAAQWDSGGGPAGLAGQTTGTTIMWWERDEPAEPTEPFFAVSG